MKTFVLKFCNGETGELRQLDDDTWPCPICGFPWAIEPPYWPNDGELGFLHSVSTPSFGDVCDCRVEFGVDDGVGLDAPIGAQEQQWAMFRLRWLDRIGWTQDALDQLRENLGITEEQLRPGKP